MIPPITALFAWPIISAVMMNALRLPGAIVVVVVAGYLLLPERFVVDFPLLPSLDKHSIPILSVLLLLVVLGARTRTIPTLPGVLPRNIFVLILVAMVIFGSFGTALTNGDRIVAELSSQSALRPYDGFSMALTGLMSMLPLLIGRKYFHKQTTHRLLLTVICIAACWYALLALYEIRMSPQLNRMFYGFFPHSWGQHVRGGAFRPLVFLEHGLQLAIFFCTAALAGAGLFTLGGKHRMALFGAIWVGLTLAVSKSLGAQMIMVVLLPAVLFLSVRLQLMTAAFIGLVVLSYPVLRSADMVPIDRVMSFASQVSAQRAGSLATRLENEDRMLARAKERPVFGWGGWGRSRVRNEKGRDITIADGYWIILIGVSGWVGYIGEFGLLTIPPLLLFLNRRRYGVEREAAVLAIMLSAVLIDAIPNNAINPVTWLIVGALWGRLEARLPDGDMAASQDTAASRGPPRYARDFSNEPSRHQR